MIKLGSHNRVYTIQIKINEKSAISYFFFHINLLIWLSNECNYVRPFFHVKREYCISKILHNFDKEIFWFSFSNYIRNPIICYVLQSANMGLVLLLNMGKSGFKRANSFTSCFFLVFAKGAIAEVRKPCLRRCIISLWYSKCFVIQRFLNWKKKPNLCNLSHLSLWEGQKNHHHLEKLLKIMEVNFQHVWRLSVWERREQTMLQLIDQHSDWVHTSH